MLDVDERGRIRTMYNFDGKSLREISKETGYHYETITKYIDAENWNEERKQKRNKGTKLEPLIEIIDGWLTEDIKNPRKQRHTGTRVYSRLKEEPAYNEMLRVGKQTVINYVSKRKKEILQNTYNTAIYAVHPVGQAQVDFGEVIINDETGLEIKIYELIVSFPYSNGGYAQLCRRYTANCLIEGLIRIFEYIGAVPMRILFDNMSSAVAEIKTHGERKLSETFERFVLHYKFKADFCNPAKGNEKGSVENKVGYIRRNMFVPLPQIADLEEYNRVLLSRCEENMEREHYKKDMAISELFKEEKSAFLPLPIDKFAAVKICTAKTDKYSFVRIDGNYYSTSPECASQSVWVESGIDEIKILNSEFEMIAIHERIYEKNLIPTIDMKKYFKLFSQKPRSFLTSPIYLNLPEIWRDYLKNTGYSELKKMLKILTPIIESDKLGDATAVLELSNIRSSDDFLSSFNALTENIRSIPEVTTDKTPIQLPYRQDLSKYNGLMPGGTK